MKQKPLNKQIEEMNIFRKEEEVLSALKKAVEEIEKEINTLNVWHSKDVKRLISRHLWKEAEQKPLNIRIEEICGKELAEPCFYKGRVLSALRKAVEELKKDIGNMRQDLERISLEPEEIERVVVLTINRHLWKED